jgi:hypothetical protein
MEPGVTTPPFHPNCRCTTVPYFDDMKDVGERAARGEDGKTYYVPSDVTYNKWKNGLTGNAKSDKVKARPVNALQRKLSFEWNGEKAFIPKYAVFAKKPRIIVGTGSETPIHEVNSLVKQYGGNPADWSKQSVIIDSSKYSHDVYWYEKDGKQIGFIAQEIELLYPELIYINESTPEKYKCLN